MKEGIRPPSLNESFYDIACDKALGLIKRDAIDPQSFSDLYSPAKISQAVRYVAKREAEFREKGAYKKLGRKLSVILEAIIHEHGEISNWFGPFSSTIRPSTYDDFANGVDEVVEFRPPEKPLSHLALAIDATFNTDWLGEKLKKILREIDNGQMAEIDFFVSSDGSYRGELKKIPHVIIGAEDVTIKGLADTWINNPRLLAEHPFQFQILEQTLAQLKFFAQYADSRDQKEIAQKCLQALGILNPINEEKKQTVRDWGTRDQTHFNLLARIEMLKEGFKL